MFSPQKAVLIDSLIHSPLLSSTLVIAASSLAAEYILEYTEILRNKDEQSLTPDVGKSLISISTEPHENIQMARDDAHRFNHSIDVMGSEFFLRSSDSASCRLRTMPSLFRAETKTPPATDQIDFPRTPEHRPHQQKHLGTPAISF